MPPKTNEAPGMTVQHFVQLTREYKAAIKRGDAEAQKAIEAEIETIGYRLEIHDGKVYIRQIGVTS